jgi:proline iminopeptidase
LKWFYGGGAGAFFPEIWGRFAAAIPANERSNLIAAYNRRLFSGNLMEESRFGRIWANWENALASIHHDGPMGESPSDYARAFARLENHYLPERRVSCNAMAGSCRNATGSSISRPPSCRGAMT